MACRGAVAITLVCAAAACGAARAQSHALNPTAGSPTTPLSLAQVRHVLQTMFHMTPQEASGAGVDSLYVRFPAHSPYYLTALVFPSRARADWYWQHSHHMWTFSGYAQARLRNVI